MSVTPSLVISRVSVKNVYRCLDVPLRQFTSSSGVQLRRTAAIPSSGERGLGDDGQDNLPAFKRPSDPIGSYESGHRKVFPPKQRMPQPLGADRISLEKFAWDTTDEKESRSRAPRERRPGPQRADMTLFVDGKPQQFSAILLRDLCECPSCLDHSTKQKAFSTADIPAGIKARTVEQSEQSTWIQWDQDVSGFGRDHTTVLDLAVLRELARIGSGPTALQHYLPGPQTLWDAQAYSQLEDFEYEAYMEDDATLFRALQQLHAYGLMFLTGVPDSEKSVSTIAERIGPVKNTFYGYTWDVRSVPQAKNVAYTSQDLGFHMDLLYMEQPPHLQFLHCIRSSSAGGASLFTDSYNAASDLFEADSYLFGALAHVQANFHYNHPSSHLYFQNRPVMKLRPFRSGGTNFRNYDQFVDSRRGLSRKGRREIGLSIIDYVDSVAWSPPFQAPFSLGAQPHEFVEVHDTAGLVSRKVNKWNEAANAFSQLIHRTEGIYERLMKPGECVIFDNRRVLHARKAFEVGDEGKERWLRGAYLDKDPFMSKMRVLGTKFSKTEAGDVRVAKDGEALEGGFEATSQM